MSVNPLALDSSWRDYSGMWNPQALLRVGPIEQSDCHLPRLALVPDILNQVVPASGKIDYNFHLLQGSLLWGFWLQMSNPNMTMQLTDVALGHPYFQSPVLCRMFQPSNPATSNGANQGRFPSVFPFATPGPVVGDGLFTAEFWGNPGDIAVMILAVAEASSCPAK